MKSADGWSYLPLPEAFWFQEGPGVRKWQFTNSGIKLVNVANIEKSGFLNLEKTDRHLNEEEAKKKYAHFFIDAGDLVIASSGISFDDDGLLRTRGAFVYREHLPLCLNTSTIRFKAIKGISDLRYLRFWLNSLDFRTQITKRVTGSAQQNFGPSHLSAIKISLPPLPEQRRIADILDRADALRAKRRAALARLDELTQAIFIEMFGDPATNPKGFTRAILSEVIEFIGGSQPPKTTFTFESSPEVIRLVQIRDFKSDDNITYIPRKSARRFFEVDDVMIGRYGPPVFQIFRGLSGSYNVALIKALPRGEVLNDFIFHLLQEPRLHAFVVSRSERTAGQSGVNLDLLEKYPAYLPPIALQQKFSLVVRSIERLKKTHQLSLTQMNDCFASLQDRAFRGAL